MWFLPWWRPGRKGSSAQECQGHMAWIKVQVIPYNSTTSFICSFRPLTSWSKSLHNAGPTDSVYCRFHCGVPAVCYFQFSQSWLSPGFKLSLTKLKFSSTKFTCNMALCCVWRSSLVGILSTTYQCHQQLQGCKQPNR